MREEKVVWLYWRADLDVYLCEDLRDMDRTAAVGEVDGEPFSLEEGAKGNRFLLCDDCEHKTEFDEGGLWALIIRDTGEIIMAGDQVIDPERVRFLMIGELAQKDAQEAQEVDPPAVDEKGRPLKPFTDWKW
jgi:hypothetical protein